MIELKPCPFCGSDMVQTLCLDSAIDVFVCECVMCKVRTYRSIGIEGAVYKWNRRVG